MKYWKRKIRCVEYDSSIFDSKVDVRKEKLKKLTDIDISSFQLAISTAKCILTFTHQWKKETAAFVRSYMEVIPFLVGERPGGYLALDNNSEKIIRDFSKTTRHGELAQGINYYIGRNVLHARTIYDFDWYVKNGTKIKVNCTGRKPDFVMKYGNGNIGILESKGTVEADPSPFLYSGHEQCKNGADFLVGNSVSVANAYVATVSFAKAPSRMTRETTVYYADPIINGNNTEGSVTQDCLYEYSKFFYLAGNEKAYKRLHDGKPIDEKCIYSEFDRNNEGIIAKWKTGKRHSIVLGISNNLKEYLCNPIEIISDSYEYWWGNRSKDDNKNVEYFSDGTYMKVIED